MSEPRDLPPPDLAASLLTAPWSLSGAYISALLPTVERAGIDARSLLGEVGLALEQVTHPGFRLSFARALDLFEKVRAQVADPFFALRLGKEVRPRSYPVLGYAAMSCATLGDAIQRLIQYERIVWNLGQTELLSLEGEVRLRWTAQAPLTLPPAIVELALSGWISLGRQLIARQDGLLAIAFAHKPQGSSQDYEQLLGAPVQFEAGWNGVVLAPELLSQPLLDADPALCQLMDHQAEELLNDYRQQLNLAGEVRALLSNSLKRGEPDLETVAAALNMSGKSLARRLSEQGTSYVQLLDEVRRDLAQLYLRQPWPLVDVAFLLGFSEQSAFSRAFKRWTGVTPGQYRRQYEMDQNGQ